MDVPKSGMLVDILGTGLFCRVHVRDLEAANIVLQKQSQRAQINVSWTTDRPVPLVRVG